MLYLNKRSQSQIWLIVVIVIVLILSVIALLIVLFNNRISVPVQNTTSGSMNVNIKNLAFSPSSLTINKGLTVVWTNNDNVAHTVTSDSGNELNSPVINPGQTYSHTFNTLGTYNYHCTIHTFMKGSVSAR